jgi:hypothetical protein
MVKVEVKVEEDVSEGVMVGGRVASTVGTTSVGIKLGRTGMQETPANISRAVMASNAWERPGRRCLVIDDPLHLF